MWGDWFHFAVAAHKDIDAPCDVVWKLLANMEDLASVFSGVTNVERIDGRISTDDATAHARGAKMPMPDNLAPVGSKWRVHRQLKSGEQYYGDWAVTKIDDSRDCSRSIVFHTTGLAGGAATATTTWTVEPAVGEDGQSSCKACRVTMTLAVVPHKLFVIVGTLMCCCVFKQRAIVSTERDLDDLNIAAIAAKDGW
eukprot:CAMPEP_0197463768 /NCGR_PEP_ID=MMETSP1175-20131217/62715_1 /TAXON_ID=1003142 /ORGANISM="Triceratium dubium, Strain CCMP147" /LENGTH=195 /DNA_ID=CAMNT_0042999609 /DNA_START=169 /DNA_END=753 /DNA_ORIENTATION=+